MKSPHFFTFLVKAFILLFTAAACGKPQPVSPSLRDRLAGQYVSKLEELRQLSAEHIAKWPSDHDCDSALWAGVARAAGADWVEVDAGVRPDGRTTRRPLRDCVVPEESATSTSNDMITGLLLGALAAGDGETIYRMYKYGEDHNWIMGYPEYYVSRVILRPNGITLMARILYKLSDGKRDYAVRHAPLIYGPTDGDYESHLALLSRYMEQELGGPQYGNEATEQYLAVTFPTDALAQAVAGKYMMGALLLTSDYISPSYVRGHHSYHLVHWLLAARIILDRAPTIEK
jgi:hypothetical protein